MLSIRRNDQLTGQRSLSWMENYSRRQQFRRMAMSLLAEKDDVLSDLGYERRDLFDALNLPLRSDAVRYLEQHRRV
ncbi:MAG: hypothetical protein COB25_014430 [Oceanospirillales bacterium]|jgi:hypothetical protein|uniref:hypothetical protein n=1 Tax=Marinobacter maritimus TaxID=277961 RepID=UPI000BD6517E|nr:hypothetical protein [Marinobacter maritimus]MBL1273641.1 hypothetical protein [Oceanospirillales bacterium]|tara:strand:- start:254 stop:481 length:228 start_codon:yes stop_codon:yes gene_type:complete